MIKNMFKLFIFSFLLSINLYSNEVYLLPSQNNQIKEKISNSILNAKSEILIAMYNFSYKDFAKDLVKASKNGVLITVVLDAEKIDKDDEVINLFKKHKIKTIIVDKRKMHLKVAVIDSEIAIFGSSNWTEESFEENYELIYLSQDKKVISSLRDFIKSF